MKIYIKKICSLDPTEYEYKFIDIALKEYDLYIQSWVVSAQTTRVKSFEEWCETEI